MTIVKIFSNYKDQKYKVAPSPFWLQTTTVTTPKDEKSKHYSIIHLVFEMQISLLKIHYKRIING